MDVRWDRLISGRPATLPEGPPGFLDDLAFLREHRGEKIAASDPATGELLGVLGLRPEHDGGGTSFRITGMEIAPAARGAGIEDGLLRQAAAYMRAHRSTRLKAATSPLLTATAGLYVTRFGARCRWREGARTPDGRPWPWVSCEIDFEDALARPLDLRDDEIVERAVLEWRAGRPARRAPRAYSGAFTVLLPDLDADAIARAAAADPLFLEVVTAAFRELHLHGYGFAWFDEVPAAASGAGGSRWYWLMAPIIRL